jgi:MoaA/NifB/PqqE/SkfB family radical SAM enzyme
MDTNSNFILDKYLNREIAVLFKDAIRTIFKQPSLASFFLKTYRNQKKAGKRRLDWEKKGVHVPPFIIFSITQRCNLSCKGCYAREFNRKNTDELSPDKMKQIIREARDLGTSIILIAGGEPLVRQEIAGIIGDFPDIIFPVFTNGQLIDEKLISAIEKNKNFIPVISIEGRQEETDSRRGLGVYEYVSRIIDKIRDKNIFWGVSITLESTNFDLVTGEKFIKELMDIGCRLFFYISFIPVKDGSEELCLTVEQSSRIGQMILEYKVKYPALFIAFPGGEEEMGGCLASGRGFVHISPDGSLEPCPFAPYSDSNLKDMSFKDALDSRFLRKIRQNHHNLKATRGGCALWENRDWVQALIKDRSE